MAQYTDIMPDDDTEAGIHRQDFANAVSTWSWMQQRETTVAEAAATFNTTPELVRQAIDDHHWMLPEWTADERNPTFGVLRDCK